MSRSHLTHRTSVIRMPSFHLTLRYCHFLANSSQKTLPVEQNQEATPILYLTKKY